MSAAEQVGVQKAKLVWAQREEQFLALQTKQVLVQTEEPDAMPAAELVWVRAEEQV